MQHPPKRLYHECRKIMNELSEVEKTQFIPLLGRAKEFERKDPLVKDRYAYELVKEIDLIESIPSIPMASVMLRSMAVRACHIDRNLTDFLQKYPHATIVNLGAGLDTTFHRLDNGKMYWYDIDLPESVCLRKQLISESRRNKFIAKSVLDKTWYSDIEIRGQKVLFLASGILLYLDAYDIKRLFIDLINEFPQSEILFDCMSKYMVWATNLLVVKRRNSRQVMAPVKWGINSIKEINNWSDKIQIIDDYQLFSRIQMNRILSGLDWKSKTSLRILKLLNCFRMIHLKFGM
jgi:O-methyltransferase involved in polyketide biosynthesis